VFAFAQVVLTNDPPNLMWEWRSEGVPLPTGATLCTAAPSHARGPLFVHLVSVGRFYSLCSP
jgi:hypothetical protein